MKKIAYSIAIAGILWGLSSCSKSTNQPEEKPEENAPVSLEIIQKRSLKRGVSFNFQMPEDVDLLSPSTSWFYNWANDISTSLDQAITAKGMNFYPMTWNGNFDKDKIRSYKKKHPNCEYLLAYNEPNLTDQANMTPAQAAAIWPEVRELAQELNMKIVSPAMNWGTFPGYENPIKWLDEFFDLVPLEEFDGIAIHCYMASPSAFKDYVHLFKKYNKKIWMTEFCAWEPTIQSASQQMRFMVDVLNYMESNDDVFRYAWFIPRDNRGTNAYPYMHLLTKNQPIALTDLGKVFTHMSTFDKSAYYQKGKGIPAAHYSSLNMVETSNSKEWSNSISVRPTTDNVGDLEVFSFSRDYWLEYQIDVPQDGQYTFDLRYSTYVDAEVELVVAGKTIQTISLAETDDDAKIWKTLSTEINLQKGKQTLRLKMSKGFTHLSWLRFR